MTVRMRHPEHGWTHAYSEPEREELERNGWKVEEPPKAPNPPKPQRKTRSKEQK